MNTHHLSTIQSNNTTNLTLYNKNMFLKCTNITSGHYIKNKNIGLGNMLFQIASALSYSIKNEANLNIIEFQQFLDIENINIKNHILRNITTNFNYNLYKNVTNIVTNDNYQKYIFDYKFYDNICLNNHFENYNNFEEIKDLIITYFSPTQNDIDYILNKYPFIYDDDICSLHIRMGPDYYNIFGKNSDHIKNLENKYIKCIEHMINKNIKKIMVFTNDKEYSMSLLSDPKYNEIKFYFSDEKEYIDIWIISLIKNNIVSVSTLSWWGSYLNKRCDKYIICCKGNIDFLHYPGWIVL